ncbi:putative C-type lectin domain family 20 member A isoform X12 [Oryctolagus cuniculus]|uniref:putative C-type lectin domain family 20 member A isoform X12 n=1 Tax=Oryctolagus cuniculus TaxID=9986 RepID=UPI00387A7FC6
MGSLPRGAERMIIKIGSQTFMRFEDVLTWSSARHYCRQYHTDLANLQAVADGEDLKPITRETEAWIGLYYNASSSSTSWAGSQNDSMPRWMEVPMLSGGQCAGLRAFFSYAPRVSAMNCSSPQPFICFYDTSIGPQAPSPGVAAGTTSGTSPGLSTSLTGAAPDPASTTRLPPPGGVTRWPSAASPSLGSTGQASATSGTAAPGGSSASSWSRGAETLGGSPGQEESVAASPRSGKPAVAQRTTAPPVSTAQSQAAARESNATAVVSTEDGTDVRPTAAGTRAQRLATSAWTRTETGGKAGHAFGILKADFVVSSLKNLEMTDQFLSECTKVHVRQKSTGYLAGKPSPANMSLVYSMMPQGLLCSSHHFEAGPNIQKYFGGTTRMRVRHDSHLAPSLLCEGVWGVRRGTPHVTPSASLLSPLRMELRPTLTWKETRLKQKPG